MLLLLYPLSTRPSSPTDTLSEEEKEEEEEADPKSNTEGSVRKSAVPSALAVEEPGRSEELLVIKSEVVRPSSRPPGHVVNGMSKHAGALKRFSGDKWEVTLNGEGSRVQGSNVGRGGRDSCGGMIPFELDWLPGK